MRQKLRKNFDIIKIMYTKGGLQWIKAFLQYKGFPLVRHEDVIYYGNMSDDYVVMLKILNKRKYE